MKKPTPVQRFHLSRLTLFVVLASAVLIAQNTSTTGMHLTYDKQKVLAYATNMSISDLLTTANKARLANGLAPLTLNSQLNTSAQLKANDMVANDYWAHVSPTGVQPWFWFEKAGYSYAAAGENLAYGFKTGTDVTAAWMNSPSHKENVLGDYTDVGFGIANNANYQGSENTVVVAHYGKPQSATPAVASAVTPTQTMPEVVSAPAAQVVTGSQTKNVSAFEQFMAGNASTTIILSIGLLGIASFGFVLTHRAFMKHLVQNGQKFVLRHPLIDASAIATTLGLVFTTTVGRLL